MNPAILEENKKEESRIPMIILCLSLFCRAGGYNKRKRDTGRPTEEKERDRENYPWTIECFLEDLFLGGQSSIILGYRRLSVKSGPLLVVGVG